MPSAPKLHFYNRQRIQPVPLPWLRKIVKRALPACIAAAKAPDAPLLSLEEVELTIISDEAITQVHADFLDDPSPTDVITFHHGEILVSADTALRQAEEHGQTLDHELALYLIHGLLHLAGWDDHEEQEAKDMAEQQFAILKAALAAA